MVRSADPADAVHETFRRIGAAVRKVRQERGRSLHELAAQAGVSESMLSMLERGQAGASVRTLLSVAAALQVPVSRLLRPNPRPAVTVYQAGDQLRVQPAPGVTGRVLHDNAERVVLGVFRLVPGAVTRFDQPGYAVARMGWVAVDIARVRHILEPGDGVALLDPERAIMTNVGDRTAEVVLLTRPSRLYLVNR